MTITAVVDVGTITAQAVIEAASAAQGETDALLLRVAVLELLRTHANGLMREGDDAELLDAYRDWLDVAVRIYSTGDEKLVHEYSKRATALQGQMDKTKARTCEDGSEA